MLSGDKEKVDALLLGQGVEVKNKIGYDHVYVANMAMADFYKSSIKDEEQLAQFINTTGHELLHVVAHICEQDGIDMLSEEPCYMMGSLCEKFFKVYD